MLSSAVERASKPGLAKQLFPSSSPIPIEDAFKAASQFSRSSNTLKPSAQSTLNGIGTTRREEVSSDGLKRPTSQLSGVTCIPNNRDRFGEKPPALVGSTHNNSISKLHEGVYFDENDFDDDGDLDFGSPPGRPITSEPVPETILPPTSDGKVSSPSDIVYFPWSSSPLEHRLPAKRRGLPWEDDAIGEIEGNASGSTSIAVPTGHKAKKAKGSGHDSSDARPVPLLEASTNSNPHPWNRTARDVKEEQKRLRQASKRLVKTNEATDEDRARAIEEKKRKNVLKIFLSEEQKRVEQLVVEKGKSVFFTGSAGTGKSVLLRSIISGLRAKFNKELDRVAVTASTGLAACNVGGVTLHSFSGVGLGKESVTDLVRKVKRNPKARTRWLRTKVLVIDEISMVDADLFDKLEGIAKTIRGNGRPFGGIQLVITGDYFQLPPVPDNGRIAKFAFEAETWSTCLEHTIGLTQVFRQKDPIFAQMLNEMRLGKLSQPSVDAFRKLSRPIHYTDGLEATELFPTRYEVENANNVRMRSLSGKGFVFDAVDGGNMKDKVQRDKLLSNCMAPISIELKEGSQVMLIKNMDDSLVNGLLGKVIDFMDEKTFDIYRENEGQYEELGSDDDSVERSKKKLKAMLNKSAPGNTGRKWPRIRFAISDGTSRDLLCSPETWKIELPNGEIQASRTQIPLILAWALSIHKAQGQTLERVKVDLGKVFEKGQAYVALSRATCQEGLQVLRFDPAKVMAHEKVRSFYSRLYNVLEPKEVHAQGEGEDYFDDEDELRAMAA